MMALSASLKMVVFSRGIFRWISEWLSVPEQPEKTVAAKSSTAIVNAGKYLVWAFLIQGANLEK
jgi:hypothetical protein